MKYFLYILVGMHILPFVITHKIITNDLIHYDDFWCRHVRRTDIVVNIILNSLSFLVSYALVLNVSVYYKIYQIFTLQCSYQDVTRLCHCLIISCILAVIWGVLCYMILYHKPPEFDKETKIKWVIGSILFVMPILFGYKYASTGDEHISIVEVCRKTYVTTKDEYNKEYIEDCSYVTLKNSGDLSYEVSDLYITNDENDLDLVKVEATTIKPNKTFKYIMDDSYNVDIKKKGGTTLTLDNTTDILDQVKIPALTKYQAYKKESDDKWSVYSLKKIKDDTIYVSSPLFSRKTGFYDTAFDLNLSCDDGLTIYYTTDGSNPTTDSDVYTGSIYVYDKSTEANQYRDLRNLNRNYSFTSTESEPVDKCFIVRAMAVDAQGNTSDIITHSYFIGLNQYKNNNVISLVSDPDNLFSDDNGIMVTGPDYDTWYKNNYDAIWENLQERDDIRHDASLTVEEKKEQLKEVGDLSREGPSENYMHKGKAWERESNFEYIQNGSNTINQLVGIRIQGGSARYKSRDKRFSVYSRKEYSGSKWFEGTIFSNIKTHSFLIREGEDNAFTQELCSNLNCLNMTCIPVDLFLDGEYWYTSYIYQKLSEKYFERNYDLNSNNVVIVKAGTVESSENGDVVSYDTLRKYIYNNDLSKSKVYKKLLTMMDMNSYIDYWACMLYLDNMDISEEKNTVMMHTVIKENDGLGDTKWRWMLYDMDVTTGRTTSIDSTINHDYEENSFTAEGLYVDSPMNELSFWEEFKKNKTFKKQFVLSFMDLVNTTFTTENVSEVLSKYGEDLSYEDNFYIYRAQYITQYMEEEFDLKGTQATVNISTTGSSDSIKLNNAHTPEINGIWSGKYYTDYPITVTATKANFDHFEVTSNGKTKIYTDKTIEVKVVDGMSIHAVYR